MRSNGEFNSLEDKPYGYHVVIDGPFALEALTYHEKDEFEIERTELHSDTHILYEGEDYNAAEVIFNAASTK
jgi:hypothetical protein